MADLGRQVKYGLGKGADVAATVWLNQLKFELNPKTEYAPNVGAFGVIEKNNDSTALRGWAEGSLESKMTTDGGGYVLLGAFGSVSSADNADANPIVKDHTFTINQDINGQPFTLVRKDSLTTEKFTTARFGKWELDLKLDDYLKFNADVLAKPGVTTTATPAFTNEPEFVAKHCTVKTASTVAGLSGATALSALESFTLTVDPNLDTDWQAGSNTPYGFSSRGYEMQFEMTARYNDTTFRDAYLNGTVLALQVSAVNTDVTIGTSAKPGLVVTAPRMIITDWSRSEDMDGPLTQSMTGTIHYSAADAYSLKAVLTNTTTSY